MKRTTISLLPLSCLLLLTAIIAPTQAFAHTDKYYIGYSQGQTQARTDYYAYANDYRPFCPVYDAWTAAHGSHNSNFCAGFVDGYNAQWNTLSSSHNARVQQSTSQDSNVRINGDGNRVTVSQQVNNNVGRQNGYGYGHNGVLPRCVILCSNIRIN